MKKLKTIFKEYCRTIEIDHASLLDSIEESLLSATVYGKPYACLFIEKNEFVNEDFNSVIPYITSFGYSVSVGDESILYDNACPPYYVIYAKDEDRINNLLKEEHKLMGHLVTLNFAR